MDCCCFAEDERGGCETGQVRTTGIGGLFDGRGLYHDDGRAAGRLHHLDTISELQ